MDVLLMDPKKLKYMRHGSDDKVFTVRDFRLIEVSAMLAEDTYRITFDGDAPFGHFNMCLEMSQTEVIKLNDALTQTVKQPVPVVPSSSSPPWVD